MAESSSSNNFIFDSLPYYDNDLEQFPILKEKVDKELAKEGEAPKELHPNVPPEVELFANNTLLRAELDRVSANQPFPPLDNIRYQLPAPTTSNPTDDDWQASLRNAQAQLEHQRIRQTNLALLQNYGSNAWRTHNYRLESEATHAEKALEALQQRTTDVNRERKNFQERLGNELTSLETRWTELISATLQIEMANVALESEIDRLMRKEADMAGV